MHGTLNIHYSLLPRWRGASPVESAILHGDTMTGVCIQKMVYELDAGDILSEIQVPIHDTDTTPTLRARLNTLGAHMLVDLLPRYIEGTVTPQPQSLAGMTKCTKIKKEDGCIDIHNLDHEHVWRMYRAYTPWPGIFFFDAMGKRVKITEMSYANNQCIIEKVIPEGKSEMSFEEWNKRNT
ncbi:MAG: hypothetical protein LRY41_01115 [Candidatus Pacebacteria bacterium]|nr:hypothetical protein [Candidatus Paceibacterota bacterium]